jgi:hypothetical protein
MTGVRKIEISLAAIIAGGALFSAFAPGASPDEMDGASSFAAPAATFDVSDFDDLAMSDTSRAVAAAVSGRRADPARFAAPAPQLRQPSANPSSVQVTPRAEAPSGPAWSGRALGIQVTAAPSGAASDADWWLVGGAGRESYAIAPGGLREFTVAPVAAETTIGDAHMGIGFKVTDRAFASVGYVREQRQFILGTQDWEEDEHYVGVGFQARW